MTERAADGGQVNFNFLDFEQPIAELEAKIEELRRVGDDSAINISEEIERLGKRSEELTRQIFSALNAWQVAKLARHPQRPPSTTWRACLRTCMSCTAIARLVTILRS